MHTEGEGYMSEGSAGGREATVTQVLSGRETMVVEATIPTCGPERVFTYWTEPALLTLWWPHEAEVEQRIGGAYHLRWPSMSWHLFGEYMDFVPGKTLAFTWRWEHEAEAPTRTVQVSFSPGTPTGTYLRVQ